MLRRRKDPLYGLLAQFETPDRLVEAAARARGEGYKVMDAYSPFPIHGLAEAMKFRVRWLPWLILAGGVVGCLGGFFMQWYASVVDYPLNIGGRPLNSWPAFIPVTFEMTILVSAITAVLGMLALNGLPTPNHPLFNSQRFEEVNDGSFFLCIESRDPRFDRAETRRFLESLKPVTVEEVTRQASDR
jgi:hypothetical protein